MNKNIITMANTFSIITVDYLHLTEQCGTGNINVILNQLLYG